MAATVSAWLRVAVWGRVTTRLENWLTSTKFDNFEPTSSRMLTPNARPACPGPLGGLLEWQKNMFHGPATQLLPRGRQGPANKVRTSPHRSPLPTLDGSRGPMVHSPTRPGHLSMTPPRLRHVGSASDSSPAVQPLRWMDGGYDMDISTLSQTQSGASGRRTLTGC
jgi:hypothetical protein